MFEWIKKRVGGKRNKNYSNMVKQAGKQSKAYTSNNIKSGSGKSSGKPKSSSSGRSSSSNNSSARGRSSSAGSSSVRGGASGIGGRTANKGSSSKGRSSSSGAKGGISGIGRSSVKGNSSSKRMTSVKNSGSGSISNKLTDINPFGAKDGGNRTGNPYGGSLIKVTSYNKDGTKKSETTIHTGSEKSKAAKGSTTSKGGITSKTVEEAVKNIRPNGSYDTSEYKDNIEKNRPVTGNANKNIKRKGTLSSKTVEEVMNGSEVYGNHKSEYNTDTYKSRAEKNIPVTNNADRNKKRKGTLSLKTIEDIGKDAKAYGRFDKGSTTGNLKNIKDTVKTTKSPGVLAGESRKKRTATYDTDTLKGITKNSSRYGDFNEKNTYGNLANADTSYVSNLGREKKLKKTEVEYDKSRVNKILGKNKGSGLAFENAEAIAKNPAFKDVGVKAVKEMSVEERKRAYAMYHDKLKNSKDPNDVIKAKTNRDKYISLLGNRHAERESRSIEREITNELKKGNYSVLDKYARKDGLNTKFRGLMQAGKMLSGDKKTFDYDPTTLALEKIGARNKNLKTRIEEGRSVGEMGFDYTVGLIPIAGDALSAGSDYGKRYEKEMNYSSNKNANIKTASANARKDASSSLLTGMAVNKLGKSVSKGIGKNLDKEIKKFTKSDRTLKPLYRNAKRGNGTNIEVNEEFLKKLAGIFANKYISGQADKKLKNKK